MNRPWYLCVLAVFLLGPVRAQVQERPTVAVSFDLAVPRWQLQVDRPAAEKQAAETIARWFAQRVGFVSFKAGSNALHKLVLHLEVAPDAGTKLLKETQLRLELIGQATPTALTWRFRNENAFADPIYGIDGLVREIELRLEDINRQALVSQILSQVSIAHEARLWKDPVGWVIPFRKTDLCMDLSSVLRIDTMLPTGAGQVQRVYRAKASGDFSPRSGAPSASLLGRLFTIPESPQDGLADLGSAIPEDVAIRAVYVIEYLRLQPCVGPVPPDAVDFGGTPR